MIKVIKRVKRRQQSTRPKPTILGTIDNGRRGPELPEIDDARIIDAIWTLRRALRGGLRAEIRALQQEIAYLRREARRALRRAAS